MRKPFFNLRRVLYSFISGLFLFVCAAQAAVTFDNTSSQGASETIVGLTNLTWTHTVNSCSNCVLYVGVSTYSQTNITVARAQSVTFGAQTLTAVGTRVSPLPNLPSLGTSSVELFRLTAPNTGTATITVTFAVPVNYAVGGANSFNGVSQSTPNSAFFSAAGDSAAATVNASDAVTGDLILDVFGTTPNAVFVAPNASQTERYNGRNFFGVAFDVGAGSTKTPTALNTPMSWNLTNSSVWALGAVTIKQFVNTASSAFVSGQIRTAAQQAISSVTVVLQNLETGAEYQTVSDAKGKYLFTGLETAHLYRIYIDSSTYRFAPSEQILSLSEAVENLDFIGERRSRRQIE